MNHRKMRQGFRFLTWRPAIGAKRRTLPGGRGLVILAALSAWTLQAVAEPTIIAIPPSPVLANFCGDVAELNPERLEVIVYPSRGNPAGEGLHRWDLARWRWQRLEWEQWMDGNAWGDGRSVVLVVELSSDAAEPLVEAASAWAAKVEVIDGYGLHEIANALNAHLRFSPAQWQYLARRHDLVLMDRNYERRRYGRFGKPGSASRRQQEPPASRTLQEALREADKDVSVQAVQRIPTEEVPEDMLVPDMDEKPETAKLPPPAGLETAVAPDAPIEKEGEGREIPSPEEDKVLKKVLEEEVPEPVPESRPSVVNEAEAEMPPPAPPAPPPGLEEALQPEDEQYWKTLQDTK